MNTTVAKFLHRANIHVGYWVDGFSGDKSISTAELRQYCRLLIQSSATSIIVLLNKDPILWTMSPLSDLLAVFDNIANLALLLPFYASC